MSSIVPLEEFEEVEEFDPDEPGFDQDFLFKITTPEETGEARSPDEVCDLILDEIEDQFWDWWSDPCRRHGRSECRGDKHQSTSSGKGRRAKRSAHGGRFKPRIKVYEVY